MFSVKVALLSGPCPPGQCGVGDYTRLLASALQVRGVEIVDFPNSNWSLPGVPGVLAELRRLRPDVIHIQYPTLGFGTRVGPQALALLKNCVITIHEASRAHLLRKLGLLPFGVRPQRIIFTSDFERDFAHRWVPFLSRVSCVIPIPSNISVAAQNRERALDEIIYFGLIMPSKRIEEVLMLATLIEAAGLPMRVRVIGTAPAKYSEYAATLRSRSALLPIVWECSLSNEEVAKRLASSCLAYLPYPDGASERRATLKAALANGIAVITTRGEQTPAGLDDAVMFCDNPQEALSIARSLIDDPDKRFRLAHHGRQYAQQFTWEKAAELHSIMYEELLGPVVISG